MITRAQWASYLALKAGELRIAFTKTNQLGLCAWQAGERAPDLALAGPRNNPLSCTLWVPGSSAFNDIGVRNYGTLESGLLATLLTLEQPTEGNYGPIREWLVDGACACMLLRAVAASEWGTFRGEAPATTDAFMAGIDRDPIPYLEAPVPGT